MSARFEPHPPVGAADLARLQRRLALAEAVCARLLSDRLHSGTYFGPPAPGSLDALLADWERETLR